MQSSFSLVANLVSVHEQTSKSGKRYANIKLRSQARDGIVQFNAVCFNQFAINDLLTKSEGSLLYLTGTMDISNKQGKTAIFDEIKLFVKEVQEIDNPTVNIAFKKHEQITNEDIPF